jgi:hypothetical protein
MDPMSGLRSELGDVLDHHSWVHHLYVSLSRVVLNFGLTSATSQQPFTTSAPSRRYYPN